MTADCCKCGHITIYHRKRKFGEEIICCLVLASPAVKNHQLTDICEHSKTAFCKTCGLVNIRYNKTKSGGYWSCAKKKLGVKARKQKRHQLAKKTYCEKCGFVAVHPRQLDIHHIDGNHDNNELENLTYLCTNCHRLEHSQTKEEIELIQKNKLLARREACKTQT